MFLLFSLYFSSLNLKYLQLTKMEFTRFAMKLFKYFPNHYWVLDLLATWLYVFYEPNFKQFTYNVTLGPISVSLSMKPNE